VPKPAQPPRYVVDRIGTPDPDSSEYFVLDVVNDWMAREALALFGNKLRQRGHEARAKEIFEYLDATLPAHAAVMEARNPKSKSKSTKKENLAP
jgi:hypothetical protein